ncbi:MAG TPA: hypothetical protein VGJ95_08560 [Pseudonocardiaceae bacterium]|jgi:hypothetical protein
MLKITTGGVHDADDDHGEPDGPIGEVSPIICKAPGTAPVVCRPQRASRARPGVRETGAICGSPSPGADISHDAESLFVEADHGH